MATVQVTPHPRLSWSQFLHALAPYYALQATPYNEWRQQLLAYVEAGEGEEFAASPLLDLLTNDFPAATRERLLHDDNAIKVLNADGVAANQDNSVTKELVALYVGYLRQIGFMPEPTGKAKLPEVKIGEEQMEALRGLGGRGAVTK